MAFSKRVDGRTAFLSAAVQCKIGTTTKLAEYKGFSVLVEKNFMAEDYLVLREKAEYKEEMSTSPVGCMTRLENLFNGIQGTIGFLEERLEKYRLDMEQAKIEYEKPFQYEEELKTKLTRQFELNNLLDMENQKETEEEHSLEEQHEQNEQFRQQDRQSAATGWRTWRSRCRNTVGIRQKKTQLPCFVVIEPQVSMVQNCLKSISRNMVQNRQLGKQGIR